ncbi:B12 binding domain protein [Pseudoflavonifractor capillosus ATCC 29799]|uniref:B12 binding domain protein n=2 Tax=Pseudoflavonifractor capillosus TaxID=106588 RepID=A6P2Q1_9FIRM|nr:B12 binding domain protein [Pseudoflavonifractor capillosus ATCC 29799]
MILEEITMSILTDISENMQRGKAKVVKELVRQAIDQGLPAQQILEEGLLSGMSVIGEKFKNNEIFVPEVLVAARAMNAGSELLKPLLMENGVKASGKVCIGTVRGDLHDIGKNLVKMMMEGKGLEVIDLGVDVAPETYVETAKNEGCQIICCSALLTTTMSVMGDVVKAAETAGIRDQVKIMIGGAPVTEAFCQQIGADKYTPDGATAADTAVALCSGSC